MILDPKLKGQERDAVVKTAEGLPDKPRILQAGLLQDTFGLAFEAGWVAVSVEAVSVP